MDNQILFTGSFSTNQVHCKFTKTSSRKISPSLEKEVLQEWQNIQENARKEGKKVWDQEVYRFEKLVIENNKCLLTFSTIPFSIRSSMNKYTDKIGILGREYYPMGTYTSIFVETLEGKYIFVQKSDKYVSRKKINFVGGVFNKIDNRLPKSNELTISAASEIHEELGLTTDTKSNLSLIGGFITHTWNVCFVFHYKIKLTQDQVLKTFQESHDDEIEDLVVVSKEDLKSFINDTIGVKNDTIINTYNLHRKGIRNI